MATPSSNRNRPSSPADLHSICDQHTRTDQHKRDALNVGLLRTPWIQAWITSLCGLPHTDQNLRKRHRLENLATALVALSIGFILCHQALHGQMTITTLAAWAARGGLIVIGWAHILYALRNFKLPNRHACGHAELTGNPTLDQWLGQTFSAILLEAPMSSYRDSHVANRVNAHHRMRTLMTPGDPTFQEIKALGFKPGVPKSDNWDHLKRMLISPHFYGRHVVVGLRVAFCTGTVSERLFTSCLWLLILTTATLTHELTVLLVAFAVPRGILYPVAQTLRVAIEHRFDAPGTLRTLASYRRMTPAIILANPAPVFGAKTTRMERFRKWLFWDARMVGHLPARVFVGTGDTLNHYCHHLKPGSDWANAEQTRLQLVYEGHPIPSNWGLLAAIDSFFETLEQQPRALFED